MSTDYTKIIPSEPTFVPKEDAVTKTAQKIKEQFPESSIQSKISEKIEFIDQGSNFESVSCNHCGKRLDISYWQQLMDAAAKTDFSKLDITLAQCGHVSNLNDLNYVMPAGFSRFSITLKDFGKVIDSKVIREIEKCLGVRVKIITARY